jgi:hypothetical protein
MGINIVGTIVLVVVNRRSGRHSTTKPLAWMSGWPYKVSQRFNAGYGRFSDGEGRPLMAGNSSAGGQGKKIEIALGVTSGRHGNSAKGPSAGRVGGVGVLKHLDILAELNPHGTIVWQGNAGDQGDGAKVTGDAGAAGEKVEATHEPRSPCG